MQPKIIGCIKEATYPGLAHEAKKVCFICGFSIPGHVAQSVMCLTADPGVPSLIPARSHTFIEIDHEIIYLLPFYSKQKNVHQVLVNCLVKLAQEKSVFR